MHYEWLGLVASTLWAFALVISVVPSNHLGAIGFNRWRMFCSSLILCTISICTNSYQNFNIEQISTIALSGFVGICIGDIALYVSLNRLGPRLSGLLFTTHVVFSVILGILIFDEHLDFKRSIGSLLIFLGVILTLYFSEEKSKNNRFAVSNTSIKIAVACGLIAGFCQALGIAIAKPIMDEGANAVAASSIRMVTALSFHLLLLLIFPKITKPTNNINFKIFSLVFINAFIALGLGMTAILYATKNGNIGLVGVLSSCMPIAILPVMWIIYRKKPQISSWFASILFVIGTSIIFLL